MREIERQKKVINMLCTAHSVLRDKYQFLSLLFEIILLIASFLLNALVFVDDKFILKMTHISAENQRIILGLSSILVFIVSIVLLKVNWKEKAANHSQAAEQLFILMQECRNILDMQEGPEKLILIQEFSKKYTQVSSMLIKIPDSKFNSLKLKHLRKVELSKMVTRHPGSFLWILRIKLFLSSLKENDNGAS